jgi:hypothetical protein
LSCKDLQILTQFGTPLAIRFGMHTELNSLDCKSSLQAAPVSPDGCCLESLEYAELEQLRLRLHELANVFTGVIIAGGLLCNRLEGEDLRRYAADICEGSERGCALVSELRSRLLAASGEAVVNRAPASASLECAGTAGPHVAIEAAVGSDASARRMDLGHNSHGGER